MTKKPLLPDGVAGCVATFFLVLAAAAVGCSERDRPFEIRRTANLLYGDAISPTSAHQTRVELRGETRTVALAREVFAGTRLHGSITLDVAENSTVELAYGIDPAVEPGTVVTFTSYFESVNGQTKTVTRELHADNESVGKWFEDRLPLDGFSGSVSMELQSHSSTTAADGIHFAAPMITSGKRRNGRPNLTHPDLVGYAPRGSLGNLRLRSTNESELGPAFRSRWCCIRARLFPGVGHGARPHCNAISP